MDELQRLIDACQAFRAASRTLGTHVVVELDPTRPADAVEPNPTRQIVKSPAGAWIDFEAAVERAIAAAADEPTP